MKKLFYAFILLSLFVPSFAMADLIINRSDLSFGTLASLNNNDRRFCALVNTPTGSVATVHNMSFNLLSGSGTPEIQALIYTTSAGEPDMLVHTFGKKNVSGSGWINFDDPLNSTVLAKSTEYWMCVDCTDCDGSNARLYQGSQPFAGDNYSQNLDDSAT